MSQKFSARIRRTSRPVRGGVTVESLESRTLLAANLVGGVDPYNMGKGDWIWQISSAEANTGTNTVQGLVDYMKARGFKWIVVKAGDGNNGPGTGLYAQFNKDLVDRVHAAGMKIFGYHFVYGGVTPNSKGAPSTVATEKTVRDKIMSFGTDGLIIDAESEWETNPKASTTAEDYAKTFKQKFPTKLLGLAPYAYAQLHTKFPYLAYGKYVDVMMPQMYWKTISIAQTPEKILADVDTGWKALYAGFAAAGHPEAIRPIVPIGQGYNPSISNPTPGTEITRFFDLLRNDADPASPFGYNGVSFWSAQHHTTDHWLAIGNGTLNAPAGSISGNVFVDTDGDGVHDVNENGASGRVVYDDTNNNGSRDAYEPFVKTDSSGNYTLSYMGARTHRIRQDVPSGSRQTVPANLLANTVTLSAGQQATSKNFGATQLGQVTGTIFNDTNADGIKQATEGSLVGWTVFADADKDGVLDDSEARAFSDSKGNYVLNAPAGSYHIREVIGSGYRVTSPASGFYDVTLTGGQSTTKFFANTTLTLITGYVFNDKTANGLKENGEAGLQGWRVFADIDGDGVWDATEASVLTDATGKYRFNTLGAGSYRIAVVQPSGWRPTVPGTGARKITIASGATTSNKNFGESQIT